MNYLEPRLFHLVTWIEIRIRGQTRLLGQLDNLRMCESAALRVLHNIDLELPHAAIKLRSERCVMVFQTRVTLGILTPRELLLAGRKSEVVAVVRANHLDLVQVHNLVLRSCRLGPSPTRTAHHQQRQSHRGSVQSSSSAFLTTQAREDPNWLLTLIATL